MKAEMITNIDQTRVVTLCATAVIGLGIAVFKAKTLISTEMAKSNNQKSVQERIEQKKRNPIGFV